MVAVILGKVQSAGNTSGRPDPISKGVQTLIGIPGAAIDGMLVSGSESFSGFFKGPALQSRIRELEQMRTVFELYNDQIAMLEAQNAELRKLANLPDYVYRLSDGTEQAASKIPGRIIQYFPAENRMTLNIGSDQQVRKGCAVVAGEGLVGIVQTVDKNRSQVQLICSPLPFRVGATVLSEPPVADFVYGEATDRLIMDLSDRNSKVDEGDLVVTSGLALHVPGGIPIGRVIQVSEYEEVGSRSLQVFPSVRMANVREVFVLR